MNKNMIEEVIGWYGAIAIIVAYTLLSFNILLPGSLSYQVLNATGAVGIAYISYKKKTYQPSVLNAIWAIVALIAIIRLLM